MNILFFLIFSSFEIEDVNYCFAKNSEIKKSEAIVGKSIYLEAFDWDISLPVIKDELEIYAIEPRFDRPFEKVKFEVKFKNSNKIKKCCEGGRLFIAKQNNEFDFSDKKTQLIMTLKLLNPQNVQVTLEADLEELDLEKIEHNLFKTFTSVISEFSLNSDLDQKFEFKALLSCKWWGIDYFLNLKEDSKERLEIDGEILYLKEKDILIFKEGRWVIADENDNTTNYPLGKIKNINATSIQIEAWDVSGYNRYFFDIPLQGKQPFFTKGDQLVSSARKRTKTHISCMMDKQRFVLKEKDMLLKKDGRWKLLKKDANFDDIKNDELFYFEKIEDRNSRKVLIGYFFNSMRTDFQKVEVPITTFSNQRRLKKR